MKRLVCSLLMLAACSRSAEIGKGYAKVLETIADPPTKLDIVFVVDDSESVFDNQAALVEAARTELFPQLENMNGELPDLHIAIVSTSVDVPGADSDRTNYCSGTPNGRFVSGPWYPDSTPCSAVSGAFLTDAPDGSGGRITNYAGAIEDAFACMATTGHTGCGYEEPLEGLRRALTIPENTGFLRDDAMLLVVFMGDEDDSSGTDPSMWPANDPYFDNVRWFEYGVTCTPDDTSAGPRTDCQPRTESTAVSPIEPYIDFLRTLKSDPSLVMVAGIIPPAGPVSVVDLGASGLDLDAACTATEGGGTVQPAVRMNAFLPEFPARYVVTSLCDGSMALRVGQVAQTVTGVMTNRPCLVGDVSVQAGRCRAFDVDEHRARAATNAVISEDLTTCPYTPSHLRADVSVAPGHHVEIECLR